MDDNYKISNLWILLSDRIRFFFGVRKLLRTRVIIFQGPQTAKDALQQIFNCLWLYFGG